MTGIEARNNEEEDSLNLLDMALVLARHWKILFIGPLCVGLAALGSTYLIAPTFTARTSLLPPRRPCRPSAHCRHWLAGPVA